MPIPNPTDIRGLLVINAESPFAIPARNPHIELGYRYQCESAGSAAAFKVNLQNNLGGIDIRQISHAFLCLSSDGIH